MADAARCRRLVAVTALSVVVLVGGAPALAQTPPPGGPTEPGSTQIEDALQRLQDELVSPGVTVRDWFYNLGLSLWGAMALIMIAWQAIQIALGGRFEMGDFVKFLFWIAVPRMILEGFYTDYELFGNQTFVAMVTNQGRDMAEALNGPGGPWSSAFESVLNAVGDLLGKVLQILIFGDAGSDEGWTLSILGALMELLRLLVLYVAIVIFAVLGIAIILVSLILVYVQTLWADVAVGMMSLAGPVFVPFLLVEQLAFLFWSWFKAILQYSLQVFVGGMMMVLIGELALGPVEALARMIDGVNTVPGEDGVTGLITALWDDLILPILQWFPIMLCCLFMSLKVGEFTAALVSGMGAPTSGMAGLALAAMTAGKSVALRAGAMAAKRFTRAGV